MQFKEELKDELPQPVFDKPLIALFDTEANVKELLTKHQFSCTEATLGSCIKVPNDKAGYRHNVQLNHDYPENLHEFDIVIFDMTKTNFVEYSGLNIKHIKTQSASAFRCSFPQTIFDPRPYAANFLISGEIRQILNRQSVIIAFCGEEETADYEIINIESRRTVNRKNASVFNFYREFPQRQNKSGKKLELPKKQTELSPHLNKYLTSSVYKTVFEHPRVNRWQNDTNFLPLLVNNNSEIVSFYHFINKGVVFVFPDIQNKASFLLELCNVYLPETFPDLFPHHGQFLWLKDEDYLLPKEIELRQQKIVLQQRYEKELAKVEEKIKVNRDKNRFLHDLLCETGDVLVKAVELYLKWLGFESVKNMDETNPEILEEDLQIETEKGLLVVEIKGIGGTSTDKDCSQVYKIKNRRAQKRDKFDVFGLYIVNHQRYISPKARVNPPFTEHQINDAVHDERGLLTTYELYKAYFLVESGILTKESVREQLFNFGLITLEPKNLKSLGVCNEIFKNGKIAILNLDGQAELTKGCKLIAKKNNEYRTIVVESIRLNDNDVEKSNIGEVGLQLNSAIKKGTEFFIESESLNNGVA